MAKRLPNDSEVQTMKTMQWPVWMLAAVMLCGVQGVRAQEEVVAECGTPETLESRVAAAVCEATQEADRAAEAVRAEKAKCGAQRACEAPEPCGPNGPCAKKGPCGKKGPCRKPEACGKKGPCAKKGPVLHYSFAKGGPWESGAVVKDLSGHGHDGRVEGDGLEAVPGIGKRVKAARFDGKCDYIRVPRDETLEPKEITVAAWVKVREGYATIDGDGIGAVAFKRNTSFHDNEDYVLEIHPGRLLRTDLSSPRGGHVKVTTRAPLAPEMWHHVAVTVGGGEARIYVDGELAVSQPHAHPFDHCRSADLFVGARDHAGYPMSRFGAFDLYELKIWNKVLDAERIAALYRERSGHFGVAKPEDNRRPETECAVVAPPCGKLPKHGDLVLHYAFGKGGDWGPGTVVKDLSGAGNDGRVEGNGLEVVDGIGRQGKAVRFDGKSDYIRVPRSETLEPDAITVAAWMRVREGINSSGADGVGVLAFKRNTSYHYNEDYCFEIYPSHVMRATFGYPPMNQTGVNMSVPLTSALWHHVVMTFQNGDIRVYMDGKESSRGQFPHRLNVNTNADLLIGMRDHEGFPPGRFGAFDLAEIKIWAKALDGDSVKALFKAWAGQDDVAKSETCQTGGLKAKPGLLLHYSFENEGKWMCGSLVKDLSGAGHDGRIGGDGLEVVKGIGNRKKAVRFDGKSDYIRVPRSEALEPDAITVAAWIRVREKDRSAGEDGIGVLVFKRNSSFHDNEDYCCEIRPNHMPQGEIANPRGMHSRVPAGMAMAPEMWHHVVLTVGGGEIRFYLDGKRAVSKSHPYSQDHNTSADLFVGTRDHAQYPLGHFGAFDLAELKIWNEVLDEARVAALYEERAGQDGVARPEDNRLPALDKPAEFPAQRTPPRVFPPWAPASKCGTGLAAELKALVEQGKRDRAASPEFLKALEALLEKYPAGGTEEKPSDKLPLKPEFRGPGMPAGWSAVKPEVWQFGDGEARQVESRANTRYVLFYEPGMDWRDYEVTLRFESEAWFLPPANSGAELYVRYKGTADSYRLDWNGNGYLSVINCETTGERTLVRTLLGADVIRDGKPWTVRMIGDKMVVEHAEKRCLELRDSTHLSGTVGLESIHIPMRFCGMEVK